MEERRSHQGWPRAAAVIGAGTMGLGVAECFAAAGIRVLLTDATPELTREAKGRLVGGRGDTLKPDCWTRVSLEGRGRRDRRRCGGAVGDVGLVFEAVPEDIGLKEEILDSCSEVAAQDAVIVSNTSSLPINDLSEFVGRPGRFCGMHWFNPPEWTPGVEVIPAAATAPEVVERLVEFLRSIGKRPAVVGDGPGFVANRIQNALFLEALRCVEEGLASPQEVDEVVRSCFGFRLPFFGPFQIADMAGLDVYENVLDVLREGLGERFEAPESLRDLVEEGRTGTKSGAGFLQYTDEERERLLLERDRRYAALERTLEDLPPVDAEDSPMIEASVLIVGAGAIGGVTAAKMEGGVRRVTVLDANEEHAEKMRDPGLLLDELGEERHVRLDAHADPAAFEDPFDFALVTLKAPAPRIRPWSSGGARPGKSFVSLGNGLVQDRIAAIVGDENLVVGTVEWGATNLGAGHLAQTTRAPFVIGEPDGETKDRTRLPRRSTRDGGRRAYHGEHQRPGVVQAARQQRLLRPRRRLRPALPRGRSRPRRKRSSARRLARGLRRRGGAGHHAGRGPRRPRRIARRAKLRGSGRRPTKHSKWRWATPGRPRPRCSRTSNAA